MDDYFITYEIIQFWMICIDKYIIILCWMFLGISFWMKFMTQVASIIGCLLSLSGWKLYTIQLSSTIGRFFVSIFGWKLYNKLNIHFWMLFVISFWMNFHFITLQVQTMNIIVINVKQNNCTVHIILLSTM